MRRIGMFIGLAALLLAGTGLALRLPGQATAQQTTPAVEALAFAAVGELPPSPSLVGLLRLTFPPGAVLPLEEGDPSLALVYVESGTLTVRIEAPVTVSRAPGVGTAEPATDEIAAGAEFTAGPGDSFVSPAIIPGEARNTGTEPVVVLAAIVEPDPSAAPATPTA